MISTRQIEYNSRASVLDSYGRRIDTVRIRLKEAHSQWAIDWFTQLEQQLLRRMEYLMYKANND